MSSVLAGPAVGMFFAELGAEVIKIENKSTGGDVSRRWRLPGETSDGPSAYYSAVNYAKRVRLADLTAVAEQEMVYREIREADLVISNYSEKVSEKLGMSYPRLKELNPGLIFLQLDGFSDSGRVAFDVVLQAETGWISMTGTPGNPAKLPVALIDILAGHQLKEAALLALIHRMRTGEGSKVTCNLEQASLAGLANQATNYLMEGAVAGPVGTLHPNIAPYGDWFETLDGKRVVLAVGSDVQFAKLCEVLGLKLHKDVCFAENPARVIHRDKLSSALRPAFATLDSKRLSTDLSAANIPFGFVRRLDEVLQTNAAKAMIREEIQEGRKTLRLSGNAFKAGFLD